MKRIASVLVAVLAAALLLSSCQNLPVACKCSGTGASGTGASTSVNKELTADNGDCSSLNETVTMSVSGESVQVAVTCVKK